MVKTLTEMTAEIVAAQASQGPMSPGEIEDFMKKTFQLLKDMKAKEEGEAAEGGGSLTSWPQSQAGIPDPKKSIQKNQVICLECGKGFKMLTSRHLKKHGLDPKGYRKKYGFSARQPLSSKTLSAQRKKTAEELGLAEKLKEARNAKARHARGAR